MAKTDIQGWSYTEFRSFFAKVSYSPIYTNSDTGETFRKLVFIPAEKDKKAVFVAFGSSVGYLEPEDIKKRAWELRVIRIPASKRGEYDKYILCLAGNDCYIDTDL